jgi:hypothetical protein
VALPFLTGRPSPSATNFANLHEIFKLFAKIRVNSRQRISSLGCHPAQNGRTAFVFGRYGFQEQGWLLSYPALIKGLEPRQRGRGRAWPLSGRSQKLLEILPKIGYYGNSIIMVGET